MIITFEDKIALKNDPSLSRVNKVTDNDINEIKASVNALYDDPGAGTLTYNQTITAAEIIAGSNVVLGIDAPGLGNYIHVINSRGEMVYNSIAHDASQLDVKYSNEAGTSFLVLFDIEATEDIISVQPEVSQKVDAADVDNQQLSVIIGGSPTVGNSDVKIQIVYKVEQTLQL